MKLTKKRYLKGFIVVVLLLAVVRVAFPGVAGPRTAESYTSKEKSPSSFLLSPSSKKHKIYSVPSFKACFPDTKSV